MNKKQVKKMLEVSRILFNNSVPVEEAKIIGGFIEQLQQENQQLNEVIDEILNNAYFNVLDSFNSGTIIDKIQVLNSMLYDFNVSGGMIILLAFTITSIA